MFDGFFQGKKIFITGNTGFKGSWLSLWLRECGAEIYGYALPPRTPLDHYSVIDQKAKVHQFLDDIRSYSAVKSALESVRPDLIFHLAAQPLVIDSYALPLETLNTNIIGTANLLEASRHISSIRTIIVITTDKCYENKEQRIAFRETDPLGGYDPYSAGKAAAELVTQAYYRSFFQSSGIAVCSVRAGNVIGGGDWQKYRLIPDIMRTIRGEKTLVIRKPKAIRPWQFVLEPLRGYLMLSRKATEDAETFSGAWNFGPRTDTIATVFDVIQLIRKQFPYLSIQWKSEGTGEHESDILMLNSAKADRYLGWHSILDLETAVFFTLEWYSRQMSSQSMSAFSRVQIRRYMEMCTND